MTEENKQKNAVLQNLIDAGCDTDFIARYFLFDANGEIKSQMSLLYRHRQQLLEKVHEYQQYLDCLDYLIYKIKKED